MLLFNDILKTVFQSMVTKYLSSKVVSWVKDNDNKFAVASTRQEFNVFYEDLFFIHGAINKLEKTKNKQIQKFKEMGCFLTKDGKCVTGIEGVF